MSLLIVTVVKLQDEYSLLTKLYRLEDQSCSKVRNVVSLVLKARHISGL